MNAPRWLIGSTVAALLLAAVVALWRHTPNPAELAPATGRPTATARGIGSPAPTRLQALAAAIRPDAISPIAEELNAPQGSIRRDLEILQAVFEAWQTNFPREGNPVGENSEITLALAGDNPLHYAFVRPTHPAINTRRELCDRWGTPFRFHALSGSRMEIISAGPDRRFATGDDVRAARSGNSD